jgi:replication factor C subunit 3/5
MLFIDKYKPTIKNIKIHNKIYELLQSISNDDEMPNMIFHGPEGAGKKTMIQIFLEMIYDETVHKTKQTKYNITSSGNKIIEENIKQSCYHIVIEPKNNNSDRYMIHDIVKEYAKRRTFEIFKTKKTFKIVLINNIDNMSYYAQTSLRRTMERYNDKCRFVLLSNSLSKVIKPLQSRCMTVRVPAPTDNELLRLMLEISFKEKIKLSIKQCHNILCSADGNIKTMLWQLEFLSQGSDMENITYYASINEIIKLLLEKKIGNLIIIRDKIFNLMITNIDTTTIIKDIMTKLCSLKLSEKLMYNIISECAKYEYQLLQSRREIFQFDALMVSLMKLIYDDYIANHS